MTTSALQSKSSSLTVTGPSGQWTFERAFNALRVPQDTDRLKSLDAFLAANKQVLTDPEVFKKGKETLPTGDDFTIRGSKHETTKSSRTLAEDISQAIGVNSLETLRVISEITSRIPEEEEKKKSDKSSNEDPGLTKDETRQLYTFGVLKERRTVLQLTRFLVSHDSIPELQDKYSQEILEDAQYISKTLTELQRLLTLLESASESIAVEHAYVILEILKTLVTILINVSTTDNNVVKWFQLLQENKFFKSLQGKIPEDAYKEIEALASVVSLLSFGLNTKDDIFDPSAPFASQPAAVRAIHDTLSNSDQNSIALYSWSIVLYSLPDDILNKCFTSDENVDEICRVLATEAVALGVFQAIDDTHKVLSYDPLYSAILSSFLICTVPFIQLTENTSKTYYNVLKDAPNTFIEKFFTNPNTERMLALTRAKFPEVIKPYLRILSINGAFAHDQLSSMDTYMTIIQSGAMKFETDPDSDAFTLIEGYYAHPPYEQNPDVLMHMPPLTKGKFFPTADQNTEAAIFQYDFNGWAILGRVLQNIALNPDEQELLYTILELITNTLSVSDVDMTSDILEGLSEFLDDNDILDLLLRLFEQALHQRNVPPLTQLTKLLQALVSTYPQIVWSHLVRSDLLEHAGRGGLIATILGSVETINGTYEFTIASLKLFTKLVTDCLSGSAEDWDSHKAEVIPKFTNYAAQVFESFMYWGYKEPHQKFEIATLVLEAFSRILYAVYAVDPETDPSKKVTKVLATSAKRVVTSFTVSLPDVRIIAPIIAAVDAMGAAPTMFDTTTRLGLAFTAFARRSLEFSKLIISIRTAIGETPSTLETSLFVKSPELIMIYGKLYSVRQEILQLLTQLVGATWSTGSPSLLSHLGENYTSTLLASIISDLNSVYDNFAVKKALYTFFSAVIQGNQKGLSMILLNGRDIRDTKSDQPSILKVLKADVKNMDYYPNWLSIHLVDAIAYAFNSWSSRRENEAAETDFVKMLVKKLTDSKPEVDSNGDTSEIIQGCYKYKLNARLAEICALVIFPSGKQETTSQPIIDLLNSSDIMDLIKPLYEPFAYRASLHENLNRNFENKWPHLKLHNFIRSPLAITNRYGEGAVYDLVLLDGLLSSDPYWTGTGLTTGYRSEVIAASLNLQLVSSQISAAKSWGALLTAYVKKVSTQSSFVSIIKKLLQANIAEGTSVALFEGVYRARIELAFFLHYSATSKEALEYADNKEILDLALQLITSIDVDFLGSLAADKPEVYRPLMRIIFKCLADSKGNVRIIEDLTSELLEFFETVIAKGSTLLFEIVQSGINLSGSTGRIEDLLLIVSLFKALIGCKPPTSFMSRLSTILVDFNTLRAVLNVYSSSHDLKVNDDFVFAELTLSYMSELISVDVIAEQLIACGLFSTLIQSPISLMIQDGGIFVQTNPRLHNIWSNGLLPVILLLLSKFGVRLLSEISAFVSYFSKQMASTIKSWSQDSVAITVPALQETEQIIILQKALQSMYHEFGQSSPAMSHDTLEIVPGLDTESGRKSLVNSLNHLLAHPKYLTSRVIPTTAEEQRLFEGEDKVRTPLVELLVSQIGDLKLALSD